MALRFFSALFVLMLMSASLANAFTFVITDTNDSTRITSLRGAIILANRTGGNNTIILGRQVAGHFNRPQPQWIFHLTLAGANENIAQKGDLDITPHSATRGEAMHHNLTIIGAVSNVTIDATGLGDRAFQVLPGGVLTLEHLTIIGGTAPGNGGRLASGEAGGAIYNAGTLSLKNCIITNNSSGGGNFLLGNGGGTEGGDGGGIYNSGTLTMNNCVVGGNSSGAGVDGAFGGNGGGIKNDGTCLLTDCVISENQSGGGGGPEGNSEGSGGGGGNGGGIYNSGIILLSNCIVSVNASGLGASGGDPSGIITGFSPGGWGGAGGNGAGIYNDGQMWLNFSTVNGNSCGNGGNGGSHGTGGNAGSGGSGAGIFNAGKLSSYTSTISDNLCGNGGSGGNSFRGNGIIGGAGGSGGGVYNTGPTFLNASSGSIELTSCTITLNQTGVGGNGGNAFLRPDNSSLGSGGQGGDGGGVLNDTTSTNVTVRNTLIALNLVNTGGAGGTNIILPNSEITGQVGNSGTDGIGFDIAGDFTSQGFNLIGVGDGSLGFVNGMNADQVGSIANPINPLIGPLQMNGGPTPTHALLSDSPAIDQGNSFGIRTDQRGHKRPQNILLIPNSLNGDGSDVGAYELDLN